MSKINNTKKVYRLIPKGSVVVEGEIYATWTSEDFNFWDKSYLVVSERALNILK